MVSDLAKRSGLPYREVRAVLHHLREAAIETLADAKDLVIPGLCRLRLRLVSREQRQGFGNIPSSALWPRYRVSCKILRSADDDVGKRLMPTQDSVDLVADYEGVTYEVDD